MFENTFSGSEIVIEEFLEGEEASFFALVDGETCLAFASAQVRHHNDSHVAIVP